MRYRFVSVPASLLALSTEENQFTDSQMVLLVIDTGVSGTGFTALARCASSTNAQAIVDALNAV